jgi:hypothetical protein
VVAEDILSQFVNGVYEVKIEITTVRNGLMVHLEASPSPTDPLGFRDSGSWFARDTTDALGRIAEVVKRVYDPVVDRLEKD